MKPNRLHWVIVVFAVLVLGAYWAVRAQEGRPLFAPPPVLPKDDLPAPTVTKGVEKKAAVKHSNQTKPKADATLIIPAEAYSVPRALPPDATERKPDVSGVLGVVQVEDRVPPPMFPGPTPVQQEEKKPGKLPPLSGSEPHLFSFPPPEPTKALIVEPAPKKAALPGPPVPAVKIPPPALLLGSKKDPEIPPPTAPMPTLTAEPTKEPIAPPVLILEPKKDSVAPPSIMVMPPLAPIAPSQPSETSRAFVRIHSGASELPKNGDGTQRPSSPLDIGGMNVEKPIGPPPLPPATGIGLTGPLTLQTPSVTVEKQGSKKIRANETQAYQIVIRNLGPGPAEQIRIEDELPPNVKLVAADPMPTMEGNKAIWVLSAVNVRQDQVVRLTLQANADTELTGRTSVHVAAMTQTTTTALRPQNEAPPLAIQLTGPDHAAVGKPVVFEVRVVNHSSQPLTGIVLHGFLSEGLTTPAGCEIVGDVDGTIPAGDFKILKMPATAAKLGRYTVSVKVVTSAGEASSTATIEITAETLLLQQAPSTRLIMGREGDLRIELGNNTGKSLRNVTIADRLPDGLDFVEASNGGLYQANSRTVYWLISQMPAGKNQSLLVRVNGVKAGQHQHVVFAKADGVPEMQSAGIVSLEGHADLSLRVVGRDDLLEQGKETTYDIVIQNSGSAPAHNVQLQVQLSPGLAAKDAQGGTRFSIDRQTIAFDAIPVVEAKGQAVFRVSVVGQSLGDQRVRCAIVSDQVRVPIQREVSTRVIER